ncbi:MAG: T9SS type A sorting domain-containing protein [Cytophagaceae bacterium]
MKQLYKNYLIILIILLIPAVTNAATFVVDTNSDVDNGLAYSAGDGTNSFRKCLRLANANAGLDQIDFAIPAAPYTIAAVSAFPAISSPVIINGYTQPGSAAGSPLIVLACTGLNGLEITTAGAGSTIRGLVIYGSNRGIYINGSNNNIIAGNFIGTNAAGTAVAPAVIVWNGIEINNSVNTLIGGTGGLIDRNVISGANEQGIRIQTNSTGTRIYGNYIGTGRDGLTAIPNGQRGIFFLSNSNNGEIGGNTVNHRNVVSGNGQRGIDVNQCTGVLIENNFVGTTVTGNAALGNGNQGIFIENNSHNPIVRNNIISSNVQGGLFIYNSNRPIITGNRIGLASDGTTKLGNGNAVNAAHGINIENCFKPSIGGVLLAERNYVSNNTAFGVRIYNGDSLVFKGNYIGVDVSGIVDHGNSQNGFWTALSDNITFGGGEAGARNIISSNKNSGVIIEQGINAKVIDNYIGTTVSGNVALGNSHAGLRITSNCPDPIVTNNIICANGQQGLFIYQGANAIIKGNRIGIALNGTTGLGNLGAGVFIELCDNLVFGGNEAGGRNIVSDNKQRGITIARCLNPQVINNLIGVNETGNTALGNTQIGLTIENNSHDPIVTHNVISSNGQIGLFVVNSERSIIKSNKIGLGLNEITSLGNGTHGIEVVNGRNAQIGGVLLSERNYVAANGQIGIFLNNSMNSIIEGNYVGTDQTGIAAKGNGTHGMEIANSRNVRIGGSVRGARNIVVDSKTGHGILITGTSKHAIVRANFVGIGANGNASLGNAVHGIFLWGQSDSATVGGSLFIERNVSSANGHYLPPGWYRSGDGIRSEGGAVGHTILGNYCGTDSTGTIARGNIWAGISLNECNNTSVGGPGAFEGNICSGNLNEGMYLRNAVGNRIYNNKVGTDVTGNLELGNDDYGINIGSNGTGSFDNIIGGSAAHANTIAYTRGIDYAGPGVYVHSHSHRNLITFNKIFCNAGKGIEVVNPGNEAVAAPVIINNSSNFITGSGANGNVIHVYLNVKTGGFCDCEGETYIGSTTVSGGTWTYTHNFGHTAADNVRYTATQTTPANSTSEFSNCILLPVDLLAFNVKAIGTNTAFISWSTGSETNNHMFVVYRSSDGVTFESIAQVLGSGNSNSIKNYSFTDHHAPEGIVYYKLEQVDFDGKRTESPVRAISFAVDGVYIIPSGEKNVYNLISKEENNITYTIISSSGQVIQTETFNASAGEVREVSLNGLAHAVYLIKVTHESGTLSQKLIAE